ncbi:MBL fold metallo-hydrolase [Cytobacillus purgationiresistens]|uniref:Glyoxylase-like metal-dependent hydrolase (Beta-lactamase superfamily II) n=1 Tax=Cytobacillus purgationiresistens TaxID=863449 RepID=A0ABU0ABT6_9BACI|nr:MBL fold metallo-hydrolase [Cytobacillus purgationiresistens]MDQ0268339.1 glyoxylase-like metal-dependent hydrolase (beta-lactamase superfamily II) [Cytobacillus purgationiresistens]
MKVGVRMIGTKEEMTIHPIVLPAKGSLRSFNFYLVEDVNGLSLIDAGIDHQSCWDLLNKTLHNNGFSLKDIQRIILTHSHEDHTGLINRILSVHPVPIYAHEEAVCRLQREEEFLLKRIDFFNQLYQEMGCGEVGKKRVEEIKQVMVQKKNEAIAGEILPVKEGDSLIGMELFETPGHSPDHIVFLDKNRKMLFGGDHLIGHISSNALVEPDRNGKRRQTLIEYKASLEKCMTLDIETVYTGHGRELGNPDELIKRRVTGMDHKAEKIKEVIKQDISVASEIAKVFYSDKYMTEFSLVMSEIIGHLDYLEHANLIAKTKKDGIWHYTAV